MTRRKGKGARPAILGGGYQPEPGPQGSPPQDGSALAPPGNTSVPDPGTVVPNPGTPVSPAPTTVPIRPAMLRFRCHAEGNVRLVSPGEVERDGGVWCPMCGNQMARDPWG